MKNPKHFLKTEYGKEDLSRFVGEIFRAGFLLFIAILMYCDGHVKIGLLSTLWTLISLSDIWDYGEELREDFELHKYFKIENK